MPRITDIIEVINTHEGPMSTAQIRDIVDSKCANVSTLLRRLEKQGYVRDVTPEGAHCTSVRWWEAVE